MRPGDRDPTQSGTTYTHAVAPRGHVRAPPQRGNQLPRSVGFRVSPLAAPSRRLLFAPFCPLWSSGVRSLPAAQPPAPANLPSHADEHVLQVPAPRALRVPPAAVLEGLRRSCCLPAGVRFVILHRSFSNTVQGFIAKFSFICVATPVPLELTIPSRTCAPGRMEIGVSPPPSAMDSSAIRVCNEQCPEEWIPAA